jgi:Na+/glutamate symporter
MLMKLAVPLALQSMAMIMTTFVYTYHICYISVTSVKLQADEAGSAAGATVHGVDDDHFCINVSFLLP